MALLPFQAFTSQADEILIDNRQLLSNGFVVAPLVAVRPVTTPQGNLVLANARITKDLIVRSAIAFPEVEIKLKQMGISDPAAMPIADFVSVIRSSDYPKRYLHGSADIAGTTYPSTMSRYAQSGLSVWDAKTLTNMVVTGVVDTDTTMMSTIDDNEVQWFKIDDKYASRLGNIYYRFSFIEGESPPNDVGMIFASIKEDVTQYDALQKSVLENVGDITFGIPIVYTASEKNLIVPKSIRKLYDVYWIDLVVTYRELDPRDVAEMAFNAAVPEQSVALKLIPLRFGVEVSRGETEAMPEMGIEYGGTKVSVGEYFSQTVSYKYLKPTIEAYGEGERRFSWRITEEAISGGSHRFAVILGVPKGTPQIDFAFSGHVRLRKSFIGEWYDGELIAGTDPWVLPVSF
jgi:hypothetical protein